MKARKPMTLGLSVVVCTYRRPGALGLCLDSLLGLGLEPMDIVVVGVAGDSSSERVSGSKGVGFVSQPRAEGIAAARNLGIESTEAPVVAFIDDDARPRPGWVSALLGAFDSPRVGGAGGPVFNTKSAEQVAFDWRVDPYGITRKAGDSRGLELVEPTLNGANMAFARAALEAVHGFDPYYRYYYDETDLCVRIARAGFLIHFTHEAQVDHDFAEGPTRRRFLYNCTRTRAYYSFKNWSGVVPSHRLLAAQARLMRQDLHAYRYYRSSYAGFSGASAAIWESIQGRLQGVLDGIERSRRGNVSELLRSA